MNGNRAAQPMRHTRTISYSEIQTALTCQARWDFAYGGRLAGDALKRRAIAPMLSQGRAWGAGVAAWHAYRTDNGGRLIPSHEQLAYLAREAGHDALQRAYEADVIEQQMAGVYVDLGDQVMATERLHAMLGHHMATAEKLPNLTQLEGRFEVRIPSRSGRQASNRYRFEGFIDGYTVFDEKGDEWIVEFKLRRSLNSRKQLGLSRQHLWYGWARQRVSRHPVVGVIVDERLNEIPVPPRILMDGTPSMDRRQRTTPELYIAACNEAGIDLTVDAEQERRAFIADHLALYRWQQRVPLLFRPGQLEEAGHELVSAGIMIHDLDTGRAYPIRNAQRHICNGCRYSDICPAPEDTLYVDSLFERVPPKRERPEEATHGVS